MPINIPDNLPAKETLEGENIFVMTQDRAMHQDIRPQRIAILNIMPIKMTTEEHILRLLSNTPLQVEIELLHMASHVSKNTPRRHLEEFYKTFDEVKGQKFDGLIITGAPVEHLDFEDVDYWSEMEEILEWSKTNVTSTLHICWAAQAGLYYHYGVKKHPLPKKVFGVFKHGVNNMQVPIVRGFDDVFHAPHSRHTTVVREEIELVADLEIISESEQAGVYIVVSEKNNQVFITGHSEYDPETLKLEYERDLAKGLPIDMPQNYFPANNPDNEPVTNWRSHANLIFTNWLNYYVYQLTPYNLNG